MTEDRPKRRGGAVVSPYLLWPRRTLEEAQRDRERFHGGSSSADEGERGNRGGATPEADEPKSGPAVDDEGPKRSKE
jgi:hypothetical protein